MKKLLLIFGLLSTSLFSVNAQVLQSENFDGLTIGNVGSSFTGASAGQGSLKTFATNGTAATTSTTNAGNSNFQVVSAGNNTTKGIQIEGPNGNDGGKFVWKDGLPAIWTSRTSGNEIIELELDINPGAGTTSSTNDFGAYIFNSAGDRVLAGFTVTAATRELVLVAYSTPAGSTVNNWSYGLAAAPGILLPANTFSRIGISYNVTSGQIRIKAPGIAAAGLTLTGSSAGTAPAEVDFVAFSGHTTALPNTLSSTMVMDNLIVRASATDTLLENNTFEVNNNFSVSPNPANDFVTISNADNISVTAISITDLNGRVVKQNSYSNVTNVQVNVSDLAAGVYMMCISSDRGSVTKKIIKN